MNVQQTKNALHTHRCRNGVRSGICLENFAVVSQDCQGITFRTVGSIGKRNRRMIQHNRDGSYNLPPTRPGQVETKYYVGSRNECNMRKDFYYTRNNRILIGSNVDSGLGESTPQEFSSCCSSSADSAKPARVVRIIIILIPFFFAACSFITKSSTYRSFTFGQRFSFHVALITFYSSVAVCRITRKYQYRKVMGDTVASSSLSLLLF